jgi:hypothetical protein
MAIEISELCINTTVVNESVLSVKSREKINDKTAFDVEGLREKILGDCKLMITELLERDMER